MPTYQFLNKKTGEEFEILLSLSEYEEYMKNEDLQQIPGAPMLHRGGVGFGGGLKIDDGFNDILKNIKKKHSGGYSEASQSTIHTK